MEARDLRSSKGQSRERDFWFPRANPWTSSDACGPKYFAAGKRLYVWRHDLKHSAIVVGDIATRRISIDESAYLKGSVNIQKEAPKKEVLGVIALSPSEAAQSRKR
jgi:hypothetical protein